MGIMIMELPCMNKVRVSMVIMCKRNCSVVFWRTLLGTFTRFSDASYTWSIGSEFPRMSAATMHITIGSADTKRQQMVKPSLSSNSVIFEVSMGRQRRKNTPVTLKKIKLCLIMMAACPFFEKISIFVCVRIRH